MHLAGATRPRPRCLGPPRRCRAFASGR
jgi:hypothetical protein